ncbi:MAG: hypothetical protein ACRYG4_16530 [Janthinobacterium lividum]
MRLSVAFAVVLLGASLDALPGAFDILPGAFAVLPGASPLAAQMVTIPLGGPKTERPSPNRWLLGSPAAVAAAVATRDRPSAMVDLDEARQPVEVLGFLGMAIGARVLDLTAEPGYFAEIIGKAIGSNGRVTILVPPAAMQDPTQRTVISGVVGRSPNVSVLAVSPATIRFAPNVFDFAVADLSSLGWPDSADFIRKIFAAVRPGAFVGVVDDREQAGGAGDAGAVKAAFIRAGFVLDGETSVRPSATRETPAADAARFVLRFRKPE